MRLHKLKTNPEYFKAVVSKNKTFEVRNDDRNFITGDYVVLQEFDPVKLTYTDKEILARINYVLHDFVGLTEGYVAFSFTILDYIGW